MKQTSIPHALRRVALLASLSLLATVSIAQPAAEKKDETAKPALTKEIKQTVLTKVSEVVTNTAYVPGVDFTKWNDFIAGEQESIDKAATERDFVNAVNAAMKKFGFSHIMLASPEAARARITRQSVGVGIQLQPEDEGLRVIAVFPNAPAEKAGLEVGDLVLL
ncbi:MAG TPA: hypothetical protein VEX38_09855, partial [Fimbriimonadaceae bacterium]|nr:hypothetical protein [Fimbriimonadaceae bacterium]